MALVAATEQSSFLGAVDVEITNTSNRTVRMPAWQLPGQFLQADLFTVTRDGRDVGYQGPMIKRGLPQAADFVILRPGQTYRTSVDLSAFYDLSRTGEYTVAFKAPLQHASLAGGEMLMSANGLPMLAQSAPLKLWVDGTDQLGGTQTLTSRAKPSAGATVVNGVSYKSCSTTQINTAGSAVNTARTYSENAKATSTAAPSVRATPHGSAPTPPRAIRRRASTSSASTRRWTRAEAGHHQLRLQPELLRLRLPDRPYEIFVCKAFWSPR